jgi:hypothetical protein
MFSSDNVEYAGMSFGIIIGINSNLL